MRYSPVDSIPWAAPRNLPQEARVKRPVVTFSKTLLFSLFRKIENSFKYFAKFIILK